MRNFTAIVPSYMSGTLTNITCCSMIKNKPEDVFLRIIIVENSEIDAYKDHILKLNVFENVNIEWVQNEDAVSLPGSHANASGIKAGLHRVSDDYVFVCHCDVFINTSSFYEELFKKVGEGNVLVGTSIDNSRINAIHQSGFYAKTDILRRCDLIPQMPELDVCDDVTKYCRENNLSYFCFENTFNTPELVDQIECELKNFHVDRCLDSAGEIMFMHLGRGIPKAMGIYTKPGRVYLEDWAEMAEKNLEIWLKKAINLMEKNG